MADTSRVNLRAHADRAHAEGAHAHRSQADRRSASGLVPVTRADVVAAQRGETDAVERLCLASYRRVVAFYRYGGLSRTDAEDLAAAVIEAVIARIGRLRNPNAYDAWMWSIARNKMRGWIRTNRRPPRHEAPRPAPATPDEAVELAEEHRLVRQALATLTPRDRELLWLREVEELSYAAIGGRLGAAVGSVRVACMRARRRLEQAYRALAGADGSRSPDS